MTKEREMGSRKSHAVMPLFRDKTIFLLVSQRKDHSSEGRDMFA